METPGATLPSLPDDLGAILIGLECLSTAIVLQELLATGVPVNLICLPGRASIPLLRGSRRRALPLVTAPSGRPTVTQLAHASGIEIWRIGDIKALEVREALDTVDADIVVVACFNRLIPTALYEGRLYGGINMHPSLLPDKRGPDPLFWVFRNDDPHVGATVHRLTSQFDAGGILAQHRLAKPDGISEAELDASLSRIGARLLIRAISDLVSGTANEASQAATCATWAPHPNESDFQLELCQSSRSAFNFVKGIEGRRVPITIDLHGREREIQRVHQWAESVEALARQPEGSTTIEFADGVLVASLSPLE